jgi:hypothetical protein
MSFVDGHVKGVKFGEFFENMKNNPKMYNLTLALQYLTLDADAVIETPF